MLRSINLIFFIFLITGEYRKNMQQKPWVEFLSQKKVESSKSSFRQLSINRKIYMHLSLFCYKHTFFFSIFLMMIYMRIKNIKFILFLHVYCLKNPWNVESISILLLISTQTQYCIFPSSFICSLNDSEIIHRSSSHNIAVSSNDKITLFLM